jgi:flagellar biosynthetic protein FliR
MIPFTEAALTGWLFAFARIAGWAYFDPLAGRLPVVLRLLLAAALAAALAPGLAPPASGPGLSTLLALLLEAAWGAALAVCVWMVFALAQAVVLWTGHAATAGLLALTGSQARAAEAPWRALAGWLAALAFLGAGGHLLIVAALRDSFAAMPVAMLPTPDNLRLLAESAGWLFATGVQLALPLLALALLVQLALGIVARTTPGLDMASTGLGLAALGLLAAWIAAVPWIARGIDAGLEQLAIWLGALAGS